MLPRTRSQSERTSVRRVLQAAGLIQEESLAQAIVHIPDRTKHRRLPDVHRNRRTDWPMSRCHRRTPESHRVLSAFHGPASLSSAERWKCTPTRFCLSIIGRAGDLGTGEDERGGGDGVLHFVRYRGGTRRRFLPQLRSCSSGRFERLDICTASGVWRATAPPPGYGPPSAPPPPVGAAPGAHMSQFGALADWGPRALGFLIDLALVIVADIVFFILAVIVHPLFFLEWIVAIGIALFFAWQVGETGQSPGMRVIGLKCISNQTGQVLGFGMGVVRALACIVNSIICYIGWLFPLWDNQRQTVADKIVSTYVITVPKQAFSVMPPS